jgi:membrane protease YdiL (CAAX protease family)
MTVPVNKSRIQTSSPPTLGQTAVVEAAFGVIAVFITLVIAHKPLSSLLFLRLDPLAELSLGLVMGVVLSVLAASVILRTSIRTSIVPFLDNFSGIEPTLLSFTILGLLAGLGEETLFRATLQPLLGIVVASLLFTLAHAPIAHFEKPSVGKFGYAVFAFAMGLVLGLLYGQAGIVAAIAAHSSFDTTFYVMIRPIVPRWVDSSGSPQD